MIVQHNMTALNANRQLGITNTNLARSTEKLSSGYRINRASDDASRTFYFRKNAWTDQRS